jgi:hypothetical protein
MKLSTSKTPRLRLVLVQTPQFWLKYFVSRRLSYRFQEWSIESNGFNSIQFHPIPSNHSQRTTVARKWSQLFPPPWSWIPFEIVLLRQRNSPSTQNDVIEVVRRVSKASKIIDLLGGLLLSGIATREMFRESRASQSRVSLGSILPDLIPRESRSGRSTWSAEKDFKRNCFYSVPRFVDFPFTNRLAPVTCWLTGSWQHRWRTEREAIKIDPKQGEPISCLVLL